MRNWEGIQGKERGHREKGRQFQIEGALYSNNLRSTSFEGTRKRSRKPVSNRRDNQKSTNRKQTETS